MVAGMAQGSTVVGGDGAVGAGASGALAAAKVAVGPLTPAPAEQATVSAAAAHAPTVQPTFRRARRRATIRPPTVRILAQFASPDKGIHAI